MEEAMMDGWICLREKPSFLISPLQLKCDRKWFFFVVVVFFLSPRRWSTALFTSSLKANEFHRRRRPVYAFIRGRIMRAVCVNEELRLRQTGINSTVTHAASLDIAFGKVDIRKRRGAKNKSVLLLDGALMFRRLRAFSFVFPLDVSQPWCLPPPPPPLLSCLNVTEQKTESYSPLYLFFLPVVLLVGVRRKSRKILGRLLTFQNQSEFTDLKFPNRIYTERSNISICISCNAVTLRINLGIIAI